MKKMFAAILLLGSSPLCAVTPVAAQGITIGPGGVGVDPGGRYRDDRDDRDYRRERYRRDRDDEDYRPRRRHRRDDDDDQ